jgi:hypothetical protein
MMIAIMAVSFGEMYIRAGVPTDQVAAGFLIPRLSSRDVPTVCKAGNPEMGLTHQSLSWGFFHTASYMPLATEDASQCLMTTGGCTGREPYHAA